MEDYSWGNTPFENRQVFAAYKKCPVFVCATCPYFLEAKNGITAHGQPGTCLYASHHDEHLNNQTPHCEKGGSVIVLM